jgi:hypothetical protein
MVNFDNYLQQNPEKQRQMIVYEDAARKMAEGGYVRMQQGGLAGMMVGEPGPPIMTSPGFNPMYEGRNAQDYGQQNRIPTFDYLYGQTPPPSLGFGGDPEPFYRPKPGETLYRTDQAAMAENPNYPGFIARTAVEPRQGGQYALTRTGERVTVPLGFFGTAPGGNRFQAAIDQRTAPALNIPPQLIDPRDNVAISAPTRPEDARGGDIVERLSPANNQAQGNLPAQPIPIQNIPTTSDITDVAAQRLSAPALPQGTQIQGVGIGQEAGQFIPTNQGQVAGAVAVPTAMATTTMTQVPTATDANVMTAETASANVANTLNTVQAAQATQDPKAEIVAAQQVKSAVGDLNAAQGTATTITNPVQRQIQAGELVSSAANAETAKAFTEQIQAATATASEKATVQGQLASLTANFDATNPPSWAAGAIRGVQAVMQQRGLGASSIAGQALVQAAMESALPIAQADARTVATFEAQNLSNRQQRAMLAAQQRAAFIGQEFDQEFQARVQNSARIADVANRNFTADQQIAVENSRLASTMNLQNLSNQQAIVIAEASALANMDLSNLNNRQQAAVQNAQNFLQKDMANLSNQQQVELFKAQQRVQSLFTDQAAINASNQFNASSQNQVDQFFANLATQSAQFNATQANAQSQYNAGQRNVLERFNAELNNQRDTFNAQNRLVIDQNNAQWRRQIATADTASTNRINELNANNLLNISNLSYNNLWQYYADTMEWAWTSAENELNRYADMSIANLNADTQTEVAKRGESTAAGSAIGSLIGTLGSAYIGATFCWVAREVYGKGDPRWFVFRMWIKYKAPKWFKNLYKNHGEAYASYISNKPILKWVTKKFMDFVIKEKGKALECQAG